MKKIISITSVIAASIIIIFYGICFLFTWQSLHPKKIFFNRQPQEFGLNAKDAHFFTDDGFKLSGWLIASEKNKNCAVILVHGYPSEKSELLPLAAALSPKFSVFLFDQRYFGTSEGNYTTLGVKEKNDLMRAIDWLNRRGYSCIGAFGHSFGGAVSLLAAAEDPRIQAIVSYGAFSDIPSAGLEKYKSFGAARYPIINAMLFEMHWWIGDLEKNSPVNAAQKVHVPLLLTHDADDKEMPLEHAKRLRDALKNNRNVEYYFPEKTQHAEFPKALKEKIKQFFINHLVVAP